jgi:hypothetical protein
MKKPKTTFQNHLAIQETQGQKGNYIIETYSAI